MDRINLHFTGDFHAITTAHNLLSAVLDNHLYFGNPARHRPEARALEAGPRHERPLAPHHHRRTRRPAPGCAARDGLRHHRGLRDHGHPLPLGERGGSEKEDRSHPGRLHVRQGPGRGVEAESHGSDARAPRRRLEAEPGADSRGRAGAHPRRTLRQHRSRLQQRPRDPLPRFISRTGRSPRRASAAISARRSSSTSSAAPRDSTPRRWCWWRRCARSRCTAGGRRKISPSPTPPRSRPGSRTWKSTWRACASSASPRSSPSTDSAPIPTRRSRS